MTVEAVCRAMGITRQAYYQKRRRAQRRRAESDFHGPDDPEEASPDGWEETSCEVEAFSGTRRDPDGTRQVVCPSSRSGSDGAIPAIPGSDHEIGRSKIPQSSERVLGQGSR